MGDVGRDYGRWAAMLEGRRLPAAFVDLDAVDANVGVLCGALEGTSVTLRVATKSVRHPWLLRHVLERGGARARGLMTFSAYEVAFLAAQGFDDFLMGYPVARMDEALALARLAAGGVEVVATVDSAAHCALLDEAAREVGATIKVCLDVDASWRPGGGLAHVGVRRSPVRSVEDALAVADAVEGCARLRLSAVLAYEAQIASLRDHNPTSRHLDPVRRLLKRGSEPAVLKLRGEIVAALRARVGDLELVNGGGTGSVRFTSRDPSVTEVTAGSGFLCPHLFDGSGGLDLRPAGFFALSVARISDPGMITCAGGGYIASGEMGADKAPIVHAPAGLSPLSMEGWGEVQTPFKVSGGSRIGLGAPVICRHAKAGELAERFNTFLLVRGGAVVGEEPTYRGLGEAFM